MTSIRSISKPCLLSSNPICLNELDSFSDWSTEEPMFAYDDDSFSNDNFLSQSKSTRDKKTMFFIHLLENFCENNTEVTKDKNVTQSKFFFLLCRKLNELGILENLDFLDNVEEYKEQCSIAWKQFLQDALHAKELVMTPNETPRLSMSSGSVPSLRESASSVGNSCRTLLSISLDENTVLNSSNNHQTSRYYSDFIEEEKLGQGGFGAVFKVTHTLDQLQYAVKKIKFRKVHSPTKLPHKILREVRCLARLEHRHVVRYFGAWMEYNRVPNSPVLKGKTGNDFSESTSSFQSVTEDSLDGASSEFAYQGVLYIQMQLCSFSLKEWMEVKNRVITSEENIAIMVQIAKALAYIHSQGLIHRDLKPSNIFVIGYDGSNSLRHACLKIGDFGVATFISDEAQLSCSPLFPSSPFPTNTIRGINETKFEKAANNPEPDNPMPQPLSSEPVAIPDSISSPLQIVPPSPMPVPEHFHGSVAHSYRTTGIGTVAYASPEQLRKDTYDEKTDLYSLGIIFLELYFSFTTRMERAEILQNLRKNRSLPSSFTNSYPKEASVVLWLTDPDPCARPSATDLLQSGICTDHITDDRLLSVLAKQLDERDVMIQQYQREIEDLRSSCGSSFSP